jgi:uncharacterized Zn-finger protein
MVCSSGVNISELNLIAKAKYLDEKGRPFRDWLLTHSYLYGWLGSLFSPIINLLLKSSVIKRMVEAILRIDRRRELSGYESSTFRQWFRKHQSQGNHQGLPIFMAAIPTPTRSMSEKQQSRSSRQMALKSFSLLNVAVAFPCSVTEISMGRKKWRVIMSLPF